MDGAGNVVERYAYEAYGKTTVLNPDRTVKTQQVPVQPYGFTGRRMDYEEGSGLYFYRLRYYDPEAGRFVSRDPLGMWGDAGQRGNAQNYCGNNPVNCVDPLGLSNALWWGQQEAQLGHMLNEGTDLAGNALTPEQLEAVEVQYLVASQAYDSFGRPYGTLNGGGLAGLNTDTKVRAWLKENWGGVGEAINAWSDFSSVWLSAAPAGFIEGEIDGAAKLINTVSFGLLLEDTTEELNREYTRLGGKAFVRTWGFFAHAASFAIHALTFEFLFAGVGLAYASYNSVKVTYTSMEALGFAGRLGHTGTKSLEISIEASVSFLTKMRTLRHELVHWRSLVAGAKAGLSHTEKYLGGYECFFGEVAAWIPEYPALVWEAWEYYKAL